MGQHSIHPAQLGPANIIFSPGDEEVARARALVDAYEAAVGEEFARNALHVDHAGAGLRLHGWIGQPAYNRASADLKGKAWNPKKPIIEWNGERWVGIDVPDFVPTTAPSASVGPFIMNAEGVARLFTRGMMRDGPFPEHYEPFEAPVDNVLHPKVGPNPVARVFKADMEVFGKPDDFPALLVINTFYGSRSLQERDQAIPDDVRRRAVEDNILIVRTLDLIRLRQKELSGFAGIKEFLESVRGGGGWYEVNDALSSKVQSV